MRLTSKQAYDAALKSKLISDNQKLAYMMVDSLRECTAKELQQRYEAKRSEYGDAGPYPALWKRLSELRNFGVLTECGKRKCRVSGRNAVVWMRTNEAPRKPTSTVVERRMGAGEKKLLQRVRILEAYIRGLGHEPPT